MSFDITILGSSGGPLEGVTCSYILKPSYISYRRIIEEELPQYLIAIDAGSGLNRVTEIIQAQRKQVPLEDSLATKVLNYYEDPLPIYEYSHSNVSLTHHCDGCSVLDASPIEISFKIFDLINNFLISHPHLDHINGLVINSPGFNYNSRKSVYGLKETTDALQKHIFNSTIWPDLISEGSFLTLKELKPNHTIPLNEIYQITPFELNHGTKESTRTEYKSTSFLIKDVNTNQHILIFGDLEADKASHYSRNEFIWNEVSELIIRRELKTILIECSTPNLPAAKPRFGHLTPDSLFDELKTLSRIISKKKKEQIQHDTIDTNKNDDIIDDEEVTVFDQELINQLEDLNILITHVKESREGHEPRKIILNELTELNNKYKLGCHFSVVLTGLTYTI